MILDQALAIRQGKLEQILSKRHSLACRAFARLTQKKHIIPALLVLNVLASTATVALVWKTARLLTPHSAAPLLAALVCALWPNQINYARFPITEAASTFFMTACLAFAASGRWGISGFMAGAASIIRTSLLPVPIGTALLLSVRAKFAQSVSHPPGFRHPFAGIQPHRGMVSRRQSAYPYPLGLSHAGRNDGHKAGA
jgi:hypothetical protein